MKKTFKKFAFKMVRKVGFAILKPFLPFLLIVALLLILASYITDIFYISDKNSDRIDMKKELSYYGKFSYTEDEKNSFLDSVLSFINGLWGNTIIANSEWPVDGYYELSSQFGYREDPFTGEISYHSCIDIPAPNDTPVISVVEGTIKSVTYDSAVGGNMIEVVSTDKTYKFRYLHLNSIYVISGQKIKKGQVIGGVGSTGRSTGPHLHFEVYSNGQLVDPELYVKKDEGGFI